MYYVTFVNMDKHRLSCTEKKKQFDSVTEGIKKGMRVRASREKMRKSARGRESEYATISRRERDEVREVSEGESE
jgi:FixJ family two-component response regulator